MQFCNEAAARPSQFILGWNPKSVMREASLMCKEAVDAFYQSNPGLGLARTDHCAIQGMHYIRKMRQSEIIQRFLESDDRDWATIDSAARNAGHSILTMSKIYWHFILGWVYRRPNGGLVQVIYP